MKLLTIHRPDRPAADDFCHGIDGELAIAMPASCDNPDCGCDRALTGLNSAKASTTVAVRDVALNHEDAIAAVLGYLEDAGWADIIDGGHQAVREFAQELLDLASTAAADHPHGTVLRPRFDTDSDAWTFTPVTRQ